MLAITPQTPSPNLQPQIRFLEDCVLGAGNVFILSARRNARKMESKECKALQFYNVLQGFGNKILECVR